MTSGKDDSGLIDLFAMQRRVAEEAEAARRKGDAAPNSAPPPAYARDLAGDEEVDAFAAAAAAQTRKSRMVLGAGAAAAFALCIGLAATLGGSGAAPNDVPVRAALASPSPAGNAPPSPTNLAAAPATSSAAGSASASPASPARDVLTPSNASNSRRGKPHHAAGPKLMKVTSGGLSP